MEFTAQQIANILKGTVDGDPNVKVNNFSKIEDGKPYSLTFLANPKYEPYIYRTNASIVLVNDEFIPTSPVKSTLIRVANAYAALAVLLDMIQSPEKEKEGIDSTAFIHPSATVGEGCYIGAFAYIGENARIGKNSRIYPYTYIGDKASVGNGCLLYPHVTVYGKCIIGNHCILHAGSVVGSDGFGFAPEGGEYKKIPQRGHVILEDDVEIGANTTVDRAVIGATIIRKGVKLDNLIQIAHNVEIGEHTVIAAQAGISGSVKVGRHCRIGGQAGLAGHIHIEDHTDVGGQSGVMGHLKTGETVLGSPSMDSRAYMRSCVVFGRLPEMYRSIAKLQQEVEQLKDLIHK
jgi:UDP-3-O-[3-hydroxymyristoyl] glucosamine N-acyltransferase